MNFFLGAKDLHIYFASKNLFFFILEKGLQEFFSLEKVFEILILIFNMLHASLRSEYQYFCLLAAVQCFK